jgi:hypothetical protein
MEFDWENIEFIDESGEKKAGSKGGSFKDFIDGTVLTREFVLKQLPYIIFLAILAIIYIGNRYHAEKLVRRSGELQAELKELRAESVTVSAELMHLSRQSEVLKLLINSNMDLVESLDPPRKIIAGKKRK